MAHQTDNITARLDALQARHDTGELLPPNELRDIADLPCHSKQQGWLNTIAAEQLQRRGMRLAAFTGANGEPRNLLASEQRQVESHQAAMAALQRVIETTEARTPRVAAENDRARYGRETAVVRPDDNWLARTMSSGSDPTGGYMVPPDYAQQFIDRVVGNSEALSVLRRIETKREHLYIPAIDADMTAAWTTEGSAISPSDPTFAQLSVPLLKVAALVIASREVLDDSSPELRPIVAAQLERAIGKAIEVALFEGGGATEPTALKDQSIESITTLGDNGGVMADLDAISDAISEIVGNGGNPNRLKIFMRPDAFGKLLKLKTLTTGSNKSLFQDAVPGVGAGFTRQIFGCPVILSGQISRTETQGSSTGVCTSIYVADPEAIALVVRELVRLEVSGSYRFNTDEIAIRAVARVNTKVLNPGLVARIPGFKYS